MVAVVETPSQAQELKMTQRAGRVLCQLFKSCDVTAVGLGFRGFLLRNTEKTRHPGGRWSQVSSALKSGGVSLCNRHTFLPHPTPMYLCSLADSPGTGFLLVGCTPSTVSNVVQKQSDPDSPASLLPSFSPPPDSV